jgi:UrcA family protein
MQTFTSRHKRTSYRAAKRKGHRSARRAAKLVMVAGGLTGTVAFADDSISVKLQVHAPTDAQQAAQVYRVIRNAARQVCAPLESRELGRLRYYMNCVNQATSMAVAQVHSEQLTALHLAQHGSGNPRL